MTTERFGFGGTSALSDLLRAQQATSLAGQLSQADGLASLAKLYREQESVATRMAILSQTRDLRSEAMNVAKYLQGQASSIVDRYLETERKRVLASEKMAAFAFSETASARDGAIDKAIRSLVDASTTSSMLRGISLAEYTWELLQIERLAQQRDAISGRSFGSVTLDRLKTDAYERYLSPEFSADYHVVEERQAEYGPDDVDDSPAVRVAVAESRAIEAVATDIAVSPSAFWSGITKEQRVAYLTLYLALIFGLMENLRWYLDRIDQQREAAELAKEKVVLEERHREAMDASDRLNRALEVLAGQALDDGVYVVGARSATVRARPGGGLVLGKAYTNQQVLVTGKSSRWYKVRFRDHLEERDIEGWVLKHYLQPTKATLASVLGRDKLAGMQ